MYARVATYEVPDGRLDEAVESFRKAAVNVQGLDGLEAGYVLVEESGKVLTVTVWSNRSTLEASETRASLARQSAARDVGAEIRSVECFEVAGELVPATETLT